VTELGLPLLTVSDVASHVGKDPKTIRRWIKRGRLKASPAGGQWLIRPEDLALFLYPESGTNWIAPEP